MESILDVKLTKAFSQGDIAAFYADFAQDYKKYESIHAKTMQHLYEFTDFNVFKKAMIERKKAISSTATATNQDAGAVELDMAFFEKMCLEDYQDTATGWQKSTDFADESKGVSGFIYEKKFDGYPLKWTRTQAVYKGIGMTVWENFFRNMEQIYTKRPEV